jgi:hypothetical protein
MNLEIDDSQFIEALKKGLDLRISARTRESDVYLTVELLWDGKVLCEDAEWLSIDSLISDAIR